MSPKSRWRRTRIVLQVLHMDAGGPLCRKCCTRFGRFVRVNLSECDNVAEWRKCCMMKRVAQVLHVFRWTSRRSFTIAPHCDKCTACAFVSQCYCGSNVAV